MCGIVGFNWYDPQRLEKMTESLRHRGPDGEGKYLDECLSLGHRRLSISDFSSVGHQPMPNEDETLWFIYNGEIYNYVELVEELKRDGYRFRSRTDKVLFSAPSRRQGPLRHKR